MRTGKLNKRIHIQKALETQNETNETTYTFVEFAEVWASIEPLSGRPLFQAQQISGDVSTRIRIRALEGVNRKMRVVYQRLIGPPTVYDLYEIDTVIPVDENRRETYLMCRKVDSEGFRLEGSNG